MNVFAPKSESWVTRRQAFKIGGLTVSFAALVAACGDDIQGDSSPGRVGYAPPITDPPEYVVDDAVLLRTASSLEYSAISVYEQALEIGGLDASGQTLVETSDRESPGGCRRNGRSHGGRGRRCLGVYESVAR